MPDLVAVTGATGFIGSRLIHRLTASGYRVRALTRRSRAPLDGIEWLVGTLDDQRILDKLVDGAAAVIHCAGQVRGRSLQDFLHTNLTGTENLVRSSTRSHPLPRFLLLSSLAAREPGLSWYAESKYRGERCLIENAGAMRWSIFRPTAVYGPGDREMAPLFRATRMGWLPLTGSRRARFGLIHVDDVVAAILCWLAVDAPASGIYELDDGTPGGYDHETVRKIASQVWKRPVRSLPVSGAIITLAASLNLGLSRLFRYSPMLTPGKARELQHPDWVCDNDRLTAAFGWRPAVRLQDALAQAV